MDWALYHPDTGYYCRPPESILGKQGDFFTASQLQPTFGLLIDAILPEGPVLELGPGRGEMREAFSRRVYRPIGPGDPLPPTWSGNIFANEFFDALPIHAGIRQDTELRELMVHRVASTYSWEIGGLLAPSQRAYVERYLPDIPDGFKFEIAERAADTIRRIYQCLLGGTVLIIDYGWTGSEYLRFPQGTLMSYRRHAASADVLATPGLRDITAHVPFPVLIDAARDCGFTVLRFETLAQTLLNALERNPLTSLDTRAQGQLKTLLFSMGESFRTLWLSKSAN